MTPFFRRRKEGRFAPHAPEWAAGVLSDDEFGTFLEHVDQAIDAEYRLDPDGAVRIGDATYGLMNIAQTWAQSERHERADVVRDHFAAILRHAGEDLDAETALERLKPRVWAAEDLEAAEVVSRPLPAGLVAVLVADLEETVVTVHPETARETGRSEGALFDLALERLGEEVAVEAADAIDLGDGFEATAYSGDVFTASQVLRLDAFLPNLPPDGAIVAIPHRHFLIVHPITELEGVLNAVGILSSLAAGLYREGPGSISDQLFWHRAGELVHLPVQHEDNAFAPPDEFVDLMNRLAE